MLAFASLTAGCGGGSHQGSGTAGSGTAGGGGATGGSIGGATGGSAGGGGGGAVGTGGGFVLSQTCVPPAAKDQPAAKLSQTGCMDPASTTKLAASVVPYDVNSPLWSDGADKQRGMALPTGGKIHVKTCATTGECAGIADAGKWVLPVGTVMVKSFLFDGKLVETRLFVHFDAATWVGYSYQWDQAQTDATVVADSGAEVMFDTGSRLVDWHYPSRMDCMSCHTPTGGSTLGTETAQLNTVMIGTTQNQIDRLNALGAFETPPAMPYQDALPIPTATTTATLDQIARSYLHANCAFCHRPDDANFPDIDLRYDVAFRDTHTCGLPPEKGNQGTIGAQIIAPGQPSMSVLALRMMAPPADQNGNHGRMPKLASYVVDDRAVFIVSQWITSITGCPQ
jgi:uncharacterized repeat protein (TIGR03806 family)